METMETMKIREAALNMQIKAMVRGREILMTGAA
jgi:hypothetical protein